MVAAGGNSGFSVATNWDFAQHAYEHVPYYRQIMLERGVDPRWLNAAKVAGDVADLGSFEDEAAIHAASGNKYSSGTICAERYRRFNGRATAVRVHG